jgi:hypothetical protein
MRNLLIIVIVFFSLVFSGCNPTPTSSDQELLPLAEFTQSYVVVSLQLERGDAGQATLVATFTPTEPDAHLYSKDLPKDGVDGVGRPTLVELSDGSLLQPAGDLQESVPATEDTSDASLPGLLVYPAGAVTLRLPVQLLVSTQVDDQVLITYMSCTPRGCHAPVVGRAVDVTIPAR